MIEEVNAAFARHIDPPKISIVKAGDFANAAASDDISDEEDGDGSER